MSESALLRAVRDRIRLSETFADHQVLVELAEEAMPTSANLQILYYRSRCDQGHTIETELAAIPITIFQ